LSTVPLTSTRIATGTSARPGGRRAVATVVAALALVVSTGAAGVAATPRVVGKVVAVGGTKNLKTTAGGSGKLHRVKANDTLTLGEVLVIGRGATATLRVSRPAGVSADVNLVDLKSAAGTPHKVLVSRTGAGTVVQIAAG
jgi:hypothetical protein